MTNTESTITSTASAPAVVVATPTPTTAKAKAPAPEVKPTLPAFIALVSTIPAPVAAPKGAFDAAVKWGADNGFPVAGIRSIRDDILSRVPHLSGKVKWVAGGTSLSAKAALKAAAQEVAKHHKGEEDGEDIAKACHRLIQLLAVLAILGEDKVTDITL